VYSDSSPGGRMLFRKARDVAEGVPLSGTEGGISPFFSPDGKWIAFVTTDGFLRKIPAAGGGGAVTVAAMKVSTAYKFGAWLDDGSIVYSLGVGVARVSADGMPLLAPSLEKSIGGLRQNDVASISALPGARGFLFTVCPANCSFGSAVWVFDAAADGARLLVPQAFGAWYVNTGHVVYTSRDGGLFAVPFDAKTLRVTGGAFAVMDGVLPNKIALSASGAAVYAVDRVAASSSGLVWVTRDGRAEPVDSSWRGRFEYPAISPDGQSIAVSVRDKSTDLWIWRANSTRQQLRSTGAS
jgi:eukaryotic-like serine/threonine-protein kinase